VAVSLTSAILHVQNQQVMSSVALAIEKLRASGRNIYLLVPYKSKNQRLIGIGSRTCTHSSFFNRKIQSELTLAFVKRASAVGSWPNSPHNLEMFGLSSLVCKVRSNRTLYELTMHVIDQDSQLFENSITEEMFPKTYFIIGLYLSSADDMTIV